MLPLAYVSHPHLHRTTLIDFPMTATEVPQWLQTVHKKRLARDNAIQRFLDTHGSRSEVPFAPE